MTDLAKTIVRAILDDLEDRRGIKQELLALRYDDEEIYEEICETLESIVDSNLSTTTSGTER